MAEVAESTSLLSPLMSGADELKSAARLRRDQYEYVTVSASEEATYFAKGWSLHTPGTTRVRLHRLKSHNLLLEDRVWTLLFRLGYPVMGGRGFKIRYNRPEKGVDEKELNVFAKDDETCFVVECKSREQRGTRSLQKDILETNLSQKPLADSIRRHFGGGYKPKIVWIYATSNIIWSQSDLERAADARIRVITENDLQYFETFAGHLGTAGRFQFLAEFLHGQEIPNLQNVKVPAVKGRFGPHAFYSFAITPRHLLKIAFVNHQALNHPDGRPAYQRMINKNRIKKIGQFISKGGFFPTNLLVNFVEKCRFDLLPNVGVADDALTFGWLYLPSKYKSAWIIDGQHRLYGFTNLGERYLDETLFVLAFERMDTKTEADLFITINHEQKTVPPSLLISLQADLKLDSDNPRESLSALGSALVKALSLDATNPFFRRFSTPGLPPDEAQNLTIPEIVKGLTRSGLLGRVIAKGPVVPGYLAHSTDRKTIDRARRVLNAYFRAIMEANVDRWRAGRAAYICVNPGVRAHLLLIQEVLKYLDMTEKFDARLEPEERISAQLTNFIDPILRFVQTGSDAQIQAKFAKKFGEGGVVSYFYNLCELLLSRHKAFGSKEFHDYRARESDARNDQLQRDVLDIQKVVLNVGLQMLKKLHGSDETESGERAYWELGIENMDIKLEATRKQQMSPREKRAPKEAYLDLIDYTKIARQPNNWPEFSRVFNIQMPEEKKGKTYYLDWIERINQLRRTAAHQTALRGFQEADFEFVEWLKQTLYTNVEAGGYSAEA
jgi:DNA sulfur modification protein DndB